MEEHVSQVYKTEKEFIESKGNLERYLQMEQQSTQKKIILETSLKVLTEDDIEERKVF